MQPTSPTSQPQQNPMASPQAQAAPPPNPMQEAMKIYESLRQNLMVLMHQGLPGIDKVLEAANKSQSDVIKGYHPQQPQPGQGAPAGGSPMASVMGQMAQTPPAPQGGQ